MNAERRLPRLTRGSYHSYRSAPRAEGPAPARRRRRRSGRAPGYLVLNTGWDDDRPRPDGALIADDRGRPVWFLSRRPGRKLFDVAVQRYRGAPVITYWEGRFAAGWGHGVVRASSTTRYRQVAAHPRRSAATAPTSTTCASRTRARRSSSPTTCVRRDGAGARQRDPGDRRRERAAAVRVAQRRQRRPARELRPARRDGEPFDYFHINSVEVGPDGDLLISARNTCALYEIDRAHRGDQLAARRPAERLPARRGRRASAASTTPAGPRTA